MAERRLDPAFPGQAYTFDEISTFYAGLYKGKAIKKYWEDECQVVKGKGKGKAKAKAAPKYKAKAVPKEPKAPKSGRFADPWFRQFDRPTDGYMDAMGFVNRLPLRLMSTEVFVHGLVDATKMWSDFDEAAFQPILCGDKAVVSVWFNNFVDTDCGGEYWETWYNTFVTPKDQPQEVVPADAGPMGVVANPKALSYLQRVVCGDTPGNPGAAMKAVVGGREIWGFPKHPELGQLSLEYEESDGKKVGFKFEAKHSGKTCVTLKLRLPEADEGAQVVPVEARTGRETCISCPFLGGVHKGHNGAKQTRYQSAMKCTQHVKAWDAKTDTLTFGDDSHYAAPIKRWDFTPVLKVHSPDFKIVAMKPSGWMSGTKAAAAVRAHEKKIADGTKPGAL